MRRWIVLLGIGLVSITQTGCFMNTWSPIPAIRTVQLIQMSEELRQSDASLARFLFFDDPSILSPQRVNGVVGP